MNWNYFRSRFFGMNNLCCRHFVKVFRSPISPPTFSSLFVMLCFALAVLVLPLATLSNRIIPLLDSSIQLLFSYFFRARERGDAHICLRIQIFCVCFVGERVLSSVFFLYCGCFWIEWKINWNKLHRCHAWTHMMLCFSIWKNFYGISTTISI